MYIHNVHMYVHTCTCTCTHMYMYMYMYIHNVHACIVHIYMYIHKVHIIIYNYNYHGVWVITIVTFDVPWELYAHNLPVDSV